MMIRIWSCNCRVLWVLKFWNCSSCISCIWFQARYWLIWTCYDCRCFNTCIIITIIIIIIVPTCIWRMITRGHCAWTEKRLFVVVDWRGRSLTQIFRASNSSSIILMNNILILWKVVSCSSIIRRRWWRLACVLSNCFELFKRVTFRFF